MQSKEITDLIIKSFYAVYNRLGFGFLEKVYENALILELRAHHLEVESQKQIHVFYRNEIIGEYYADILVNNSVIIELKVAKELSDAHEAQLINYLRATQIEVGLLLNFGKKAEFRRKVFSNQRS